MYWTNRACSKEMKRRERAESHPGTQLEWSIICLISFILRQVCVCVSAFVILTQLTSTNVIGIQWLRVYNWLIDQIDIL